MFSVRACPRFRPEPSKRKLCRSITTEADVAKARNYCANQLRHGDHDAHLVRPFVPKPAQDAYNALRALNLELARLPETVSSPTIGQMRLQFWRDSLRAIFAGNPTREPICLLLHHALTHLFARSGSSASLQFWLMRFLDARARHVGGSPFASLVDVEEYAEHTYASLMYMTLAAVPLRSVRVDHLASHIGKACGIAATLRGVPVLAAPPVPGKGPRGAHQTRNPVLLLPLDVLAECGVREEEVFRKGPEAKGLQDAVFKVATRANDHLITAREMMRGMKARSGSGHDYEHGAEAPEGYIVGEGQEEGVEEIKRGFGIFLEAVPVQDYLLRLEDVNFDPFRVRSSWKLPWRIWRSLSKLEI